MKNKLKIEKELTPKDMVCSPFPVCPAIFKTNNDSYVIIGKKLNSEDLGISNRIGKDEVLIEVPKRLIDRRVK